MECGALEEPVAEPPPSNGLPSWTQRIFQVGNDGGDDDDGQPAVDPEAMSESLWGTVCLYGGQLTGRHPRTTGDTSTGWRPGRPGPAGCVHG